MSDSSKQVLAMAPIVVERRGTTLVIQNNAPATRNALTFEYTEGATAALRAAATDDTIAAIVLTGAGGHFCAGGDLNSLLTRRDWTQDERIARVNVLHDLIRAIVDVPKPVIAAVEGAAAGAGFSIALACDWMVAAESAYFSVAYVKVGLTPDGGCTAFLAEFLTRQQLSELCWTGARISAKNLADWGAVTRLCPSGAALDQAIALAQTFSDAPPRASARIKRLCRSAHHNSLDAQLNLEAQLMAESLADAESNEGMQAFLEKRTPKFRP